MSRRNKRMLDILLCLLIGVLSPALALGAGHPKWVFLNLWRVLSGRASWVGYAPANSPDISLPALRPGVLNPADAAGLQNLDEPTRHRLNFFYAKDYQTGKDLDILINSWRLLGRG